MTDAAARLAAAEIEFAAAGGRDVALAEEIDTLRAQLNPRRWYRRVITVELLSEEPYHEDSLEQVGYDTMEGDISGMILSDVTEQVDGRTMANLLINQGSDPEFFQLDDTGNYLGANTEDEGDEDA